MSLIGYKVSPSHLEGLVKQLKANNKYLNAMPKTPANTKLVKDNLKQIKLIEDGYNLN